MQYIFLLYDNEANAPAPPTTPEGWAEYMKPWEDYSAALRDAGVLVGGDALEPTATATTVRAGKQEPVFTDGPFAETKEQLGGYYLVECADLDQALRWASECPVVRFGGSVEVRPVMDLSPPA